jgi:hypothetical protein
MLTNNSHAVSGGLTGDAVQPPDSPKFPMRARGISSKSSKVSGLPDNLLTIERKFLAAA